MYTQAYRAQRLKTAKLRNGSQGKLSGLNLDPEMKKHIDDMINKQVEKELKNQLRSKVKERVELKVAEMQQKFRQEVDAKVGWHVTMMNSTQYSSQVTPQASQSEFATVAPEITESVDASKINKVKSAVVVKSKFPSASASNIKSQYDVKGKPERISKEQRSRNKEKSQMMSEQSANGSIVGPPKDFSEASTKMNGTYATTGSKTTQPQRRVFSSKFSSGGSPKGSKANLRNNTIGSSPGPFGRTSYNTISASNFSKTTKHINGTVDMKILPAAADPDQVKARKNIYVKSKAAVNRVKSAAPRKSLSPANAGSPKAKPNFAVASATEDTVDPIYKNKDPISTSVKERVEDGGSVLSVVRKKKAKAPFYFTMQLNGEGKQIPSK